MWGMDKAKNFMQSFFSGDTNEIEGKNPLDEVLDDIVTKEDIAKEFEEDIIADINQKYHERKNARNPYELQMRLNINFYNGDQFTKIDSVRNDIIEVAPLTEWEERNAYNEIAPSVETRCAILSKRKNNLKNRPASSSSEDRTSAKIGNKVLASTKARLNMSELQQEANYISEILGSAIWKTVWDTSSGRVVGEEIRELTDEEKQITLKQQYEKDLLGLDSNISIKKIREGDVVTTVHSPFEIYPENIAAPCRKQSRIMHVCLMSPEEVFNKWGVIEQGKKHQTYKIMPSDKNAYGSSIAGRFSGNIYSVVTANNTVEVREEWELPSPNYPKGRLIITTEEHLLHYGPLPDALGENGEYILPFDVQQSLKTDGFFGTSVIERMIDIQIEYNSVKNRIQDYINRVTIGTLTAEEGSLTDEDDLLDEGIAPGTIITYKRGASAPRFLSMDDLPSDVMNEASNLLSAFDRYSGVSQLAKQSIVPSQVTSGVAIAGLAEQDDTRIGLDAENIKHTLVNVGKKWLVLYHNNVSYPRTVKEIGKNNEFEIELFKGSDLTSFDVFVESEPEASDTLSQRRQKVIELLNGGLFNDPQTGNITPEGRIKVFEMLELGDWENFIDADDDQKKRAQRENNMMITGEESILKSFDDDMIHIAQHNGFRLKAEYEDAVSKTPEIDAIFEAHVNAHLASLQKKSQAQVINNQEQPYIQKASLSPNTFGGEQ